MCYCGESGCLIIYGECHCGCGDTTWVATYSSAPYGYKKGVPVLFSHGHSCRIKPQIEDAVPFKIGGAYCRLIPLTKGYYSIVLASDYLWLSQWRWVARKSRRGHVYAVRGAQKNKQTRYTSMHSLLIANPHKKDIDHRNRNTTDNRRSNLRVATRSQNNQNSKIRSDNTSGYKGVSRHRNKWIAYLNVNGTRLRFGGYDTRDEARARRAKEEQKYYGEFVCMQHGGR
jgi:hypothetical protein